MSANATSFQWLDTRMAKDPVKYPQWICDQKWNANYGKPVNRIGFYMDEFLMLNLNSLPNYLKNAWDVVGIVSGHGKVRIGKTQPKGSLVMMSNGEWREIERIKIGDKVMSPGIGGSTCSIATVKETHSRFEEECYDVISNKTGKVLYSCTWNHDIPVEYNKNIKETSGKKRKYLGFEKIKENIEARTLFKKSRKWMMNQSLGTYQGAFIKQFEGAVNPDIDAYSLGYYLGDGHFSIKHGRTMGITSETIECISEISSIYPIMNINNKKGTKCKTYTFSISGDFAKQLIRMGLDGKKSHNKFIPEEAMKSTYKYRLALLAGLIDSDGYINTKNNILITLKSKGLIEQIIELVRSLGGTASISKVKKGIKSTGFVGEYYQTSINLGERTQEIPIKNKFKLKRMNKNLNPKKTLIGFHLEKSKPSMVYGFSLNNRSKLYITDNFTVTHNSSIAQQVGLYVAWLIAGGKMKQRDDWMAGESNKFVVSRTPKRLVRFTLKENIVFSPEQLMDKAGELYKKYGKHQVIIYDEGRAGLDSAKAMSAINKAMQDFFQECGMYGHIIIIVLPSFFKLHEDYATARTLFLIDVYANKEMRRGFFNFYNEQQKEYLYLMGKKMVGTIGKYRAGFNSFSGRFTKFLPFDKDEYEAEKMKALSEKVVIGKRDAKYIAQRNHLFWMINEMNYPNRIDFAEYWNEIFDGKLVSETITDFVAKEEQLLKDTHGLKNLRTIKRNVAQLKDSKFGSQKIARADIEALS